MLPSKKKSTVKGLYKVERILAERYNPKKREKEFLLKWENFGDEENSWEPESNLECDQLIKEFYRNKKESPKSSRKRRMSNAKNRKSASGRSRIASASIADISPNVSTEKVSRNRTISTTFDEIPAPEEGESLMEKGIKPLAIIGSCRGKGIAPFDYIVKFENKKTERVSAVICNNMYPQMVVDFFAKSAGHC